MSYYTGSVCAVPVANRDAYVDFASRAWPFFQKHGALRMVENWGEDVRPGKQTDFLRAVDAKDDEAVVFSWIEWPDRATADGAWQSLMSDSTMGESMGQMPYDGKRMFWGGFGSVAQDGTDRGAGYIQGFIVPVPEENRATYIEMAHAAWSSLFKPHGSLGQMENWGEDVPRGEHTDFYRAVDAQDGEAILFSWTAWPDRASCDAAARAMEQDMANSDHPMPEMPFDGKRMIWAGFAPVFDSDDASGQARDRSKGAA